MKSDPRNDTKQNEEIRDYSCDFVDRPSRASTPSSANRSTAPRSQHSGTPFFAKPLEDVHVWRVPLNPSSDDIPRLRQILSSDEQERADRFHFDKDRNQFIQSRAALRLILSDYLNVAPDEIEFTYGPQGKPSLANGLGESKLRFNISRRDGLALIAAAYDREVGIDVEIVRDDLPVFEVADLSFSPTELATLRSLPDHSRTAGFYNCWTRKEAYVKARGEGLSFPLKQFNVSLSPGEPATLLHVEDKPSEAARWTFREVPVGDNYVAAIAVVGTDLNVTYRDWTVTEPGAVATGS